MEAGKEKILIGKIKKLFSKKTAKNLNRSNAFPDACDYSGVRYVAFRTAFTHFPTPDSKIVVYKKNQSGVFVMEAKFSIDKSDVRNPKFFVFKGNLCLIFAVTPTVFFSKKKPSIYVTSKVSGHWLKPKRISRWFDLSPFRVRTLDNNTPILSAFIDYLHPSSYRMEPDVSFLYPIDLYVWRRFKGFGKITIKGTETDFMKTDKGFLIATRIDYLSGKRPGSRLLLIDNQSNVTDHTTRIKLDAPYIFTYKNNHYVLSRRNVFFRGRYNLMPDFVPDKIKTFLNMFIYWLTPKRLALWRINDDLTISHVVNFPVQGDTGYAVALPKGNGSFEIITYSNDSSGHIPWFFGQLMKSYIYSVDIKLV